MIVSRYILLYTTTYLFNVIVIQFTESGIDALFKITKIMAYIAFQSQIR
ncbi:Uncharacterised protein [Yersinia pseudotuberculosis]|uniref:Uncharacterized protein n=1 Tax=Yersinia pseudotuberculosis TaxID=633 RepID=A0A380Q6F0_YERPU|nr:Uncharacterised protein [Yersinia pseudotuberculosis]SUP81311.1 Uncharacterised protein [Yersinia pseudotuberculosis]